MRSQKRFKLFLLPAIIASSYIYSCSLNKDKFKDDFEEIVKEIEDRLPSNKTEGTVLPITPIDEVIETSEPEVVPEPEPEVEPEVEKYTATFVMGDTEVSNQYEEGEEIIYPDAVEIEHYHFVRWNQDIQVMPAEAIRIEAIYEINKHTLTFNLGYGNIIQSEVEYGSSITYPEIPTNEENIFTGWDLELSTMPDEDIVISATWREKIKGVLNYKDENNNESSLTWDDLVDSGAATVGTFNGMTSLQAIDTSEIDLTDGVLIIDESIEYISDVTGQGQNADKCAGIKRVIIPDSVKGIYSLSFKAMPDLEEVVIGSQITEIPSYCFYQCSSLKRINVDNISKIGSYAFAECTSLEEFSLLPVLTTINNSVFSGCTGLKEVTIDTDCFPLQASHLFEGCVNLEKVNRTDNWKTISPKMFYNCSKLKLDFLEGIETIGEDSFRIDTDTFELNPCPIVIPSTIKSLHGKAFYNWDKPYYIDGDINFVFANTPSTPASGPFFSNEGGIYVLDENGTTVVNNKHYSPITQIKVPRNLTKINKYLFANVTTITDIYIPRDVTTIGGKIFYNLPLKSVNIHYEGTAEEWAAIPKSEKSGKTTISNPEFNTDTIEYNAVLDY